MTTKTDIEAAIEKWGAIDQRELLPQWLRDPRTEHQFALAMAVLSHQQHPDVTPSYGDRDELTGWRGIGLKEAPHT
jgi:hypothetical protein